MAKLYKQKVPTTIVVLSN